MTLLFENVSRFTTIFGKNIFYPKLMKPVVFHGSAREQILRIVVPFVVVNMMAILGTT
jgi:hypothetical protein